jgi:predicted TIM-barrel fold metal-dependent hydrolase
VQTITESLDKRVSELGFWLFDADNHYYEPEDAFLRFADHRFVNQAPRWVEVEGGGKRLVFGDRINRYLGADQTFRLVGRPGGLAQGQAGVARQQRENLEPIRPEMRERDARLAVMDKQGLEATMLFPTLGVSVEQLIADDVDVTYANLRAFNRWLDDDWGFNYKQRIYGVPLLSLLDPFLAIDELEFVVSRGARVVHLRSGPVAGHSPADPFYDRFWRAVVDADLAIAFHASDDPYRYEMAKIWGWGNVNIPARHIPPLHRIIAGLGRPIHDMIATLIYGKLFERFPALRVATVELGSDWVPGLFQNLERAGQGELDEHPIDVFKKHVWVTPFEDEDIAGLATMISIDRVMFGSDYPHTDGLAEPASIIESLKTFSRDDLRKIVYDNPRQFVGGR